MIMIIIAMRSGDTPTENLKARHCSHCFQYFLASRVLAFFLPAIRGRRQGRGHDGPATGGLTLLTTFSYRKCLVGNRLRGQVNHVGFRLGHLLRQRFTDKHAAFFDRQ